MLAALGYSYRYLGGLRRFNRIALAIETVKEHGFGALFNNVPGGEQDSLASVASR